MTELIPWLLLVILVLLYALFALFRRYRQAVKFTRTRLAELEALSGAGRAIVEAQLDVDALCELIAKEAGKVIDTSTFQIGLFDGDLYRILYWSKSGERQQARSFDLRKNVGIVGWVRSSRQTLTIGDYQKELDSLPARPRYLSDQPPRSGIFIPLLSGSRTLGIMAAHSDEPYRFTTNDVRSLTILANQAAAAISHADLYEQARRRAAQLELVGEIARQVSAMQDLDELMQTVVRLTRDTFGFHPVGILGIDDATGDAVLYASTLTGIRPGAARIPRGAGLIGAAAARKETVVSNDVMNDARFRPAPVDRFVDKAPSTRAEIAIPLIADQNLFGVLDVQSERAGVFGRAERPVLEALAAQVATAIDKTRQWASQREQAWITTAQLQVAEALGQSEGLEELLAAICRLTPLLVGVHSCGILLWEPDAGQYYGAELYGQSGEERARFRQTTLSIGDWHALDSVHVGRGNLLTEQTAPWLEERIEDKVMTVLYALIAQGRTIGAMVLMLLPDDVLTQNRQVALSARQEELLKNISQQAAQAIAGEISHVAQQEEAWVNAALLQVAEAVNSLIELNEILDTIVRLIPMLIGVDKCMILVWDDRTHTFRAGPSQGISEMGRGLLGSFEIDESEFPAIQVHEENRVLATPYYTLQLPGWLRTVLETDAAFVFPLFARASLVGVLLVTPPVDGLPLAGRRLNILTGIGQQAAIAVVNDQLYKEATERSRLEKELDVAHSIQASFIPPGSPDIPKCSVASIWQAARQVSGDFYDFLPLSDGKWGIIVADVADKGVPAALFMALSRTVLRTIALNRENPARTLERANEIIWNDTTSDLFVTVFYGILDSESETLVYANAGHNPPIILRQNGRRKLLQGTGMALGVLPGIDVKSRTTHFHAGDVLLCYTDGVTEAVNEDVDEFGMERLLLSASAVQDGDAESIMREITGAIHEFTGETPQFDDITLVVVKREIDS